MRHHDTNDNRNDASASGGLARLHDLDHYKVADGDPDIRGWEVRTSDGQRAGKVDDLIVDTGAMKVRYIDVELDRDTLQLTEDRHVLVPLQDARLDDERDDVLLGSMSVADVIRLQPYRHAQPVAGITGTAAGAASDRDHDPSAFYGKRGGTGAVERMLLSEEEMRVGTRTRQTGEVDVRKTVETEHVSQTVPVTREEVVIERRAVSGDQAGGEIHMGEDEIRIPINQEEAVIEKRVVPREEVIIKKQAVQGEQVVEADLRRERVDIDRDEGRASDDYPADGKGPARRG